ncbi:phage tail tape measure protein [Enterobacter cancerogenus]|uniref:phage tail tape measure protein n=1 Tax=Enterobacter cancerogenus TaxID=69218 RepID=UPI000C789FB7|nr:phage tail tape measure protein [Enterobacter cancerogenus]AUJ81123.1 phage tail tape measure protein [Enterobacter cancerogenus]
MASKSLGTLTIDLIARIGGFVGGLSQAERASQKWRKQVKDDAKEASVALTGFATAASAAALGVGAAGFNLLKSTSKQITESDRWAKSLKISTQELLAWQFAAEKAGVSGDQMADIFKDIGDKIGDAVLNHSGEAVDALNALGLSAEKLSKATPDKQLLAIGDALGKIGSNAEKTTILESLGNDLSKLLPLFDNNNEKLRQFIDLAKDYGIAPDPSQIEDLVKVNSIFEDMESQAKALKLEIAAGLAKVDLSQLTDSFSDIRETLTDPQVLQGLVNLVQGVAELAGWLVKGAAAAGDLSAKFAKPLVASIEIGDSMDESVIRNRLEWLANAREFSDSWVTALDRSLGQMPTTEQIDKETAALNERLKKVLENKKAQQDIFEQSKKAGSTIGNTPISFALGQGETNGKTKPDSTLKKLESSFKSMETSYLRQIALIDTTGKKSAEVTEQQKLQFDIADGKLAGLNETQKTRLEQLATEVDRLNSVKKANEENIRLAEYVANLQRENSNAASSLDADVIGAGLGDKARERMREQLDIEREFNEKREDLQRRFQSGDIKTSTEYDRYNQELDKALAVRLEKYRSHYEELDKIQDDWLAGAQDGLANWIDTSSDYYSQVSGLVGNTLDGWVDNMADALNGNKADWADWANSVLSELQKVLLRAILVNSLKSAGDSGLLGSLGGMFGGASSGGSTPSGAYDSAAYGLTLNAKGGVYDSPDLSKFRNGIVNSPTMFAFAKGAGLMGEAGPEAIMPLTRTADGSLGVRMVDDAVSSISAGGNSIQQTIQQHFTISGNGDAALKQAMQEAAAKGTRDGAKQARQEMLQDFKTNGQGRRLLGV